jgi:hypothetical protein
VAAPRLGHAVDGDERIATATGITRLTGECLAINEGFVSLARSLGYRVHADGGDRSLLRIEKDISGGQT